MGLGEKYMTEFDCSTVTMRDQEYTKLINH